jgi:hypothetical protein
MSSGGLAPPVRSQAVSRFRVGGGKEPSGWAARGRPQREAWRTTSWLLSTQAEPIRIEIDATGFVSWARGAAALAIQESVGRLE